MSKEKNATPSIHFRSVFITLTKSIVLVCLILCTVFFTIFSYRIISNNREILINHNKDYLNTITTNTDYLLEELLQSQTQMSYSGNILGLIYSKSISKKYVSNINLELIHLADNTTLIQEAFLYVPAFQAIISSAKRGISDTSAQNYPYHYLVTDYQTDAFPSVQLDKGRRQSTLFYTGEDLVLVRNFPLTGDKSLASLYYIINLEELNKILLSELPDSADLEIYTDTLTKISQLGASEDILKIPTVKNMFEKGNSYVVSNGKIFFHMVSESSGWHYFYNMNSSLFQLSFSSLFFSILPSLVLLLLLSIILSFFVAKKIYQPIRELMKILKENKNEAIPDYTLSSSNELEYFQKVYQKTAEKKQELNNILASISHDTTSRIFHDLMADTLENKETLPELLTSIKSPYHANDLYQVCLIEFQETEGVKEDKIALLKILNDLCSQVQEHYPCQAHALMMQQLSFCMITAFLPDTLIASVRNTMHFIKEEVLQYAQKHNLSVSIASGHIYYSIYDLRYSYQDAQKKLEEKQTSQQNNATDATILQEESDNLFSIEDYDTLTQHIFNSISCNDLSEAQSLAHRIMNQIQVSITDLHKQADAYIYFITSLLDKILKLPYVDHLPFNSIELVDIISSSLNQSVDSASLCQTAMSKCDLLIEETGKILKKQRNSHIIAAQEYIAAHYQDYDLCLDNIASAIDINSSYLSRLFKNSLGIRFTDYLNGYRINRSIELLEHTSKSVKSISEETGFSSVQNYIRVFKKITGYTPKQYRELSSENLKSNNGGSQ